MRAVRMPGHAGKRGFPVGLLGPVEVRPQDGDPLPLSRQQRVAVAVLATQLDRPVPADRLVEALWGDMLPVSPAAALRNLVSRLRRLLGGSPGPLVTEPAGYRLVLPADTVDTHRFEDLLQRAAGAAGAERIALMDAALALWRGTPTTTSPIKSGRRARRSGSKPSTTGPVSSGRGSCSPSAGRRTPSPNSMPSWPSSRNGRRRSALLMDALAMSGRHTDALDRYERWRLELAQRGLEPSPALHDTQVRVLRHTSAPEVEAERWRTLLPRPISSFVGREDDLDAVAALLDRSRLVTLVGVGGVGKTRLAVASADRLADRHPGGTWSCDLSACPWPSSSPPPAPGA